MKNILTFGVLLFAIFFASCGFENSSSAPKSNGKDLKLIYDNKYIKGPNGEYIGHIEGEVMISPGGTILVEVSDEDDFTAKELYVYDYEANFINKFSAPSKLFVISDNFESMNTISDSGKLVGGITKKEKIVIYDVKSGIKVLNVDGEKQSYFTVHKIEITKDDKYVVVMATIGAGKREVQIYSLDSDKLVFRDEAIHFDVDPSTNNIIYHKGYTEIFTRVSISSNGKVFTSDFNLEHRVIGTIGALEVSPNGKYLYTGNFNNVGSIATGEIMYNTLLNGGMTDSTYNGRYSQDGNYIVFSGQDFGSGPDKNSISWVIDIANGKYMGDFGTFDSLETSPNCEAMNASGQLIRNTRQYIELWDVKSGEKLDDGYRDQKYYCVDMQILNDGKTIIVVNDNLSINKWVIQ